MTGRPKPLAIVDTSFWSIAVRIGILPSLLDEFRLAAPAAVRSEILAEDPRRPRSRPDYQDTFREVEPALAALPQPEPDPVAGLDPGEAAVVGCARALGAIALINERRGKRIARALDVIVVDVPQVVILMLARGRIDVPTARRLLTRIRHLNSTPAEQLSAAESSLDTIAATSQSRPPQSRGHRPRR